METKASRFRLATGDSGWTDEDDVSIIHTECSLREACMIAKEFDITNLIYEGPLDNRYKRCNWTFTFNDGSTITMSLPLY